MQGGVDQPERILMIRPSALGDVGRSVPALATLRAAYPDATIDWLVRDTFIDCVRHHPMLSEAVPFPRKALAKTGRSWKVTRQTLAWLNHLKRRRYDVVYDLQGLLRSGIFAGWTRAKRRVGFREAAELGWLGYNVRYSLDVKMHTVDRMVGLLEADGLKPVHDMRLYTCEEDRNWAEAFCAKAGLGDGPYAVIAPTAMWKSKQWPIDRFGLLAARLRGEGMAGVVMVGSPADVVGTRELAEKGVIDAVGQTSVGQLMALIQRSELTVSNDSAALHLAVGLGVRCVGIFGPSDPGLAGPYRYDVGSIAAPNPDNRYFRDLGDSQDLIAQLSFDDVWTVVGRVLDHEPPVTVHPSESA